MRTRVRTLHANGRRYTWRAEIRHVSGHREVRLRAWGTGKNGQALQVDLHPTDPLDEGAYPDAEDVRTIIAEGLTNGWQPDTRGGTFTLPPHSWHATHESPIRSDSSAEVVHRLR